MFSRRTFPCLLIASSVVAAALGQTPTTPAQPADAATTPASEEPRPSAERASLIAKIRETEDPAARAKLVRSLHDGRPEAGDADKNDLSRLFEASQAFLDPFFELSAGYTEAVANFFDGGTNLAVTGLKTPADLAARRALVQSLADANAKVTRELQGLDVNVRDAIASVRATPTSRRSFMEGLNNSLFRQRAVMLNVRTTEAVIWKQLLASYAVLEAQWGHWKINEAGAVIFEDAEAGKAYNKILDDMKVFGANAAGAAEPLPKVP